MKKVYLHGSLGEKFGKKFELAVSSPREAMDCLGFQLKGFFEMLHDGEWRITHGAQVIDENMLAFCRADNSAIHFIPMPLGSKEGGVGKIILGAVLIAVSFFIPPAGIAGVGSLVMTQASLATFGAMIALGGVAQMLTPTARTGDVSDRENPEVEKNGIFGGLGNTSAQGATIPIIIGTHMAGTHVVDTSLTSETVPLVDILESEFSKEINIHTGTWTEGDETLIGYRVGAYYNQWDASDQDDQTSIVGTADPAVFRNKLIGTWHEMFVFEEKHYFRFSMNARNLAKNYVKEIKLYDDQDNLIVNFSTALADDFDNDIALPNGNTQGGWYVWRSTQWEWHLGTGVWLTAVDNNYRLVLEYDK